MLKRTAIVTLVVMLSGCDDQRITALTSDASRPRLTEYTAMAAAPVGLDPLNNSSYVLTRAINDAGMIIGQSSDPVSWNTGVNDVPASTIPSLLGIPGNVYDINASGQISGEAFGSVSMEAVLWTPAGGGTYTRTSVGLPGAYMSAAYGLNDKGQVVGSSRFAAGSGWVNKCFLWTPSTDNGTSGSVQELPGLGGAFCVANEINQSGQVVGSSTSLSDSYTHGFVWQSGVTTVLQPSSDDSYATSINNAGQIVGWHTSATTSASVWNPTAGGWTNANDLGAPALAGQSGFMTSYAMDINDAGFVVGFTRDGQGLDRPFFWNSGTITELADPHPVTVMAGALTNVVGNRVIIAGSGIDSNTGIRHAVRWSVSLTPIVTEGCSDRLVRLIGELKAAGALNSGTANSLLSKVDGSARQAKGGKTTAARNILYALIEEVDGMRNAGRLTTDQATSLKDAAMCVIAGL